MPRADFYLITTPRFREEPLRLVCELAKKAFNAGLPTLVVYVIAGKYFLRGLTAGAVKG